MVESPTTTRPAGLQWQFGLSFLAFVLIGASDGAGGVLLPSLGRFYNVDKATISLLFLLMTGGYLSAALSSGPLVERLGQRHFLMLGTGLFGLAALAIAWAPPFPIYLAILLFYGFGVGIIDAGLNAYIAGLPNNTAPLNYLHAFYGLGALLGPVIASTILAIGLGWNAVYVVWLVAGFLVLAGIARFFTIEPQAERSPGNVLGHALRLPVVWLAALFLLAYVGSEVSLGTWSYSFLTEERHGATLLSAWTVSGYWLGLTVGRLVMGKIAARLGNRRLIEGCLVGVAIGLVLVWIAPDGLVSAGGLVIAGFSLGPIFPTTIAILSDLVPARLLQSAIGFAASLGSMGAAFFPWIVGNMAQAFGLWTLLPFVIGLTVILFALWFVLSAHGTQAPGAPVDSRLAVD